jgi:folylpolyglutamate synthase/dihydropteroate synthase
LADKDFQPMCQALAPLARRILTVPVGSRRTAPPEEVAAACRQANPTAMVETCHSLRDAFEQSAREPFLIVTGSLYLVGEAMEWLELSPVKPVNERGLNEWAKK